MASYFISDLHLPMDSRTSLRAEFDDFLQRTSGDMEQLFILGDLVEAWMGDDLGERQYAPVVQALKNLVDRGTDLFFLRGNHDFLVTEEFMAGLGGALLDDVVVMDLFGRRTVLCHGDTLCTRDASYQEMRGMLRSPSWQEDFLRRSERERSDFVRELVARSERAVAEKAPDEMDVVPSEVRHLMSETGAELLIHGHTHKPAMHRIMLGERQAQRIVLGAWQQDGEVLRCDREGFRLISFRQC